MTGRMHDSRDTRPFLMVGFEGTSMPPGLGAWLRNGDVSGVVLFARNVEGPRQVRELCRELRAAAGRGRPAPLIAIDQEGGRVRRLKDPRFTQFPPARSASLFCCHAEQAAYAAGAVLAEELSAVGVDINFAPVLDVDPDAANWAIGDRSFSDDPETAARLGIAFMKGTLSRRVIPVGKHFPGHGHADADSHDVLPTVRASRRTLLARDVVPFLRAIRAGIPALMTAHVNYPALDPDFPATLSRKILHRLLREKLMFRGVMISDALEMKAISRGRDVGEATVRALKAGCDIAMVCNGEAERERAVDAIAREYRDDAAFREASKGAIRRVKRLRDLLPGPGSARAPLRSVGSKAHREVAALLSDRWENTARTSSAGRSDSIGER